MSGDSSGHSFDPNLGDSGVLLNVERSNPFAAVSTTTYLQATITSTASTAFLRLKCG